MPKTKTNNDKRFFKYILTTLILSASVIATIFACTPRFRSNKHDTPVPVTSTEPVTTAEPVTTTEHVTMAQPVTTARPVTETTPNTDLKFTISAEKEKEIFASAAVANISLPSAPGILTSVGELCTIDYSNTADGYLMIKSTASQFKTVVRITTPPGEIYDYMIQSAGDYICYPLSSGSGVYRIALYEQIEGNKYILLHSVEIHAEPKNEFTSFLYPNCFVDYNADTKAVKLAAHIASGVGDMEKIEKVYNYIIDNLTYDRTLAAVVQSGYIPDLDRIITEKSGICFDYASLMTAMLRGLNIPTKLIFGYAAETYHAWISVYTSEHGWINDIIRFDGNTWKMMDPTYASTAANSEEIHRFIENTANYNAIYRY